MRIGDLEGLNEIYDAKGNPVLKPGEQILRRINGDNIYVWKGKRALSGKVLIGSTKEKGTLYLTDTRLIFIRTPDPALYLKTYGDPLSLSEGVSGSLKARDLKALGLKVFAELPYQEVRSFKSHRRGKWMELRLDDEQGIPIRMNLVRRKKDDDKILVLEEMLVKHGAGKLD